MNRIRALSYVAVVVNVSELFELAKAYHGPDENRVLDVKEKFLHGGLEPILDDMMEPSLEEPSLDVMITKATIGGRAKEFSDNSI